MAVTKDGFWRRCALIRVVDGDTLHASVDLGYQTFRDQDYRLTGVNAPEIFHGDAAEVERGKAARSFVIGWLAEHAAHTSDANRTNDRYPFMVGSDKSEKYGRYLAVIQCGKGHSLNHALLDSGNAVPYMVPKGEW